MTILDPRIEAWLNIYTFEKKSPLHILNLLPLCKFNRLPHYSKQVKLNNEACVLLKCPIKPEPAYIYPQTKPPE